MIRRLARYGLAAALFGFVVFWWLTIPQAEYGSVSSEDIPSGDPINGEVVFWASGCASCHADEKATGDEKLLLGGGHRFETPFGTFVAPNISSDPLHGLGNWEPLQFADAILRGSSSSVGHYYPSFPYASYQKMERQDVLDLFSYLKTLPAVARPNEPHELALPFQWRRPLGIWKLLFVGGDWVLQVEEGDEKLKRGRYLVEVLGHCGECHTPRNVLGGMKRLAWLAGGPSPEGIGKIPNITPHPDGIGGWLEGDIAYYLESGFTPDYDSVGGSMVAVQKNMAKLPKSDLEAIAAYLKSIPPLASN